MTDKFKMNLNTEQAFHEERRAFIIMRDATLSILNNEPVLVWGGVNQNISHEQILREYKFDEKSIHEHLMKSPRGYYMNGEICLYQGCDMTPGAKWELAPQNYQMVQSYIPMMRRELNLNDNTNVYLGVVVGEIGHVWEKINKMSLANFMRMR